MNREGAKSAKESKDRWQYRSSGVRCGSCMFFLNFRCRRHAPTMGGWPAVFPDDWCGDHKLCKETMAAMK